MLDTDWNQAADRQLPPVEGRLGPALYASQESPMRAFTDRLSFLTAAGITVAEKERTLHFTSCSSCDDWIASHQLLRDTPTGHLDQHLSATLQQVACFALEVMLQERRRGIGVAIHEDTAGLDQVGVFQDPGRGLFSWYYLPAATVYWKARADSG